MVRLRRLDWRHEQPDPNNDGRSSGNRFLGLRNSGRNNRRQTIS